MLTSFSARSSRRPLREQPEHDEAEAEIVGLGQRVQARERVGKAQKADRAGQEKERAGSNRDVASSSSVIAHPWFRVGERPVLTNAMDAKVASSASINATSTAAGTLSRRRAAARRQCRQSRSVAPPSSGRHLSGHARCMPGRPQHRQDQADCGSEEFSH